MDHNRCGLPAFDGWLVSTSERPATDDDLHGFYDRFQRLSPFSTTNWKRVPLLWMTPGAKEAIRYGYTYRFDKGKYEISIRREPCYRVAATLLHEMAHVVLWHPRAGHHRKWRRTFLEAAQELVGVPIDATGSTWDVDIAVEQAILHWIDGERHLQLRSLYRQLDRLSRK